MSMRQRALAVLRVHGFPQHKMRLEIPEIAFHFLLKKRLDIHKQTKRYSLVWVL